MRFGWLTALCAALFVAPAAEAASPPPSVRYTFSYEYDLSQLRALHGPGYDTFTPVSVSFSARDLTFLESGDVRQYLIRNGGPTCASSLGMCDIAEFLEAPIDLYSQPYAYDMIITAVSIDDNLFSPVFRLPLGSFKQFGTYKFYDQPGLISGSLTITPDVGVPEPATWAMMILGFAAIGGAMRRRRVVSNPATAA